MLDYKGIEQKWQKAWDNAKVYEIEPNERPALLVTAAFPYVNSPQHMGHIRTYGTADTYARYMRMRGFNVLYPMAFHATGTPLLAFAKRINNNDKELIDELKMFHVPDNEISKMADPRYIADYFVKEMEYGMRIAGYGVDWRRKFVSIEPLFSRMVEWQFLKLREKGYITKGKHPIGWCTNDNNAVGQHDTKHDVDPEIEEVTVIKFKDPESGIYFGCSTYRPETVFGVTNLFVSKDSQYVIAEIGGSRYYMTREAAEMLSHQMQVTAGESMPGAELLKKKAINPVDGTELPVLPGFFVKPDIGTGVVMSVPAHAPFDYVALQRLKEENYPMPEIAIKKVMDIEESNGIGIGRSLPDVSKGAVKPQHPEIPALAYLEVLNTDPKAIDDMIEFATKLAYREESHWGVMSVKGYEGLKEPEARERIKKELESAGSAISIFIIGNEEPVFCRCGTKVIVKMVEDQWFINYGDQKWKELAHACFNGIKVRPEKLRLSFERTIDWLDLKAAEREQGLGTKFPFDEKYVIESLSDSTIYMCFYTFVHLLRASNINPDALKPEFFDYVLLGTGDAAGVAALTGIDVPTIEKCRESFTYWYTNTSRHSGPDLIPNHLTMYIFNHCGLLPNEFWPKQIAVNGFVDYEGEKMSKSLGNIVPLVDGISKYGSDPLRFIELTGADLDTSTEFTTEGVNSIYSKNDFIYRAIQSLPELRSKELSHMDYWLYSKLNSRIKAATAMMDMLDLKGAYTEIYYNSMLDLKKYMERGGENGIVMREYLEKMALMLAPVMPHVSEELWSALGKTTFAVQEKWPEFDQSMINEADEAIEEIVDNTIADIRHSEQLTGRINSNSGKSMKEIRIILSSPWKSIAYNLLADCRSIGEVMSSESLAKIHRESLSAFLSQFSKRINSIRRLPDIKPDAVMSAFVEARDYISDRFKAKVLIENEVDSSSKRASRATPEKPSIDLFWD